MPASVSPTFIERFRHWYEYLTYTGGDGKRYRWRLLDLLTQVFGHAWYHRGQIAMLVNDLGGEAVDTDFIFWNRPTLIEGVAVRQDAA